MIFNSLLKKPETEEQRIIRYTDIIVANSDYKGELDNDCLDVIGILTKSKLPPALAVVRNELRRLQPNNVDSSGTTNIDITSQFVQSNYDVVRNHLLNNGYIDKPDHTQKWILNDKGKLMKELGGHKKYIKHRRREINIIKNQNFLNWGLIIATALAAIMPWIAQSVKPNKQNQIIIRMDSVWLHQQIKEVMQKKEPKLDTGSIQKTNHK